jgi:glycosyltransferase involved in cell wall biosynthesis
MSARPKLTVAVPFPVHPPVGGGQQRVFGLYRHVARDFDVELVTIAGPDTERFEGEIAPGLREIRIPKSAAHQAAETRLEQEVGGIPVGDIGIPLFVGQTPEFGARLACSIETAALVVACHPYALPAIRGSLGGRPLVYEAQDVEYLLKTAVLARTGAAGAELAEGVRALEAEACRESRLIWCCSESDRDDLRRLYGVDPARLAIVPNGVDTAAIRFTAPAAKAQVKAEFGLAGQRIALFVGSWHPPNLEAAELVFEIAQATPDVTFLLAGSQCLPMAERPRPTNVGLMGVVDDETLGGLLALADVALNPMLGGSGTNLKLATYLAAGVPVITTPIGARGYALVDGVDALIARAADFPAKIRRLVDDGALAASLAHRGRRLVVERYDWKAIASEMVSAVRRLLDLPARRELHDTLLDPVCAALAEIGASDDTRLARQLAVAMTDLGFDRGAAGSLRR